MKDLNEGLGRGSRNPKDGGATAGTLPSLKENILKIC